MVDTLGAEQDSVVFLGRRSFRMELVEKPGEEELAIPRRGSDIPTEKIFHSNRDLAASAALASSQSGQGISNTTLIALCSTTFILGITLTLMISRGPEPRRSIEAMPPAAASAAVVDPASAVPVVASAPVVVALPPPPAPPAISPSRRPLAKPARAVRPRPARAARSEAPAATPWVDPFAE